MMNQIALRFVLIILLAVNTQGSIEKNQFRIFNQPYELKNEKKNESNERTKELAKTKRVIANSSDAKAVELLEENKERLDIKKWLTHLPKIEENSKAADFINRIGPIATVIAKEKGIYPSVMIAQAGLESGWGSSDLARKHNNLMGTKGSKQGNNVTMTTREEVAGEEIEINAGFSIYNSWGDSLNHYGRMMRDGLDWDNNYYEGTWRENTESYKDATAWLVGRYATDSSYAEKLNKTIEKYNLMRFDEVNVLDYDYEEILTKATVEI